MNCCSGREFDNCCEEHLVTWEGKSYCLFHAPAECPEKQGEDNIKIFNELIHKRIDESIKIGSECNLSGVIFPGYISFRKYNASNQLPTIFFTNAVFCKGVYFTGVNFGNVAVFSSVSFKKIAEFSETVFNSNTDFNDTVFCEEIVRFKKAEFNSIIYFTNSKFGKGANFSDSKFGAGAYFDGAEFGKNVTFSRASFCLRSDFDNGHYDNIARFINARFNGKTDFSLATFLGNVNFEKSEFADEANFNEVNFGDNNDKVAHFTDAIFYNNAFFKETKFNKVSFLRARFDKNAYFDLSIFNDKAVFSGVVINEYADFSGAEYQNGSVYFSNALFGGWSSFVGAKFHNKITLFKNASFLKEADFTDSRFRRCVSFKKSLFCGYSDFVRVKFNSFADFSMCTAELSIRFAEVDLCYVSFLQAAMLNIHFESCAWPYLKSKLLNREIRYCVDKEKNAKKIELIEEFYRKMKEKYKKEGNEREASQWHLAEKEARRKSLKLNWATWFEWFIHRIYWLSSGYAEMPGRALLVLVLFFAGFILGMIYGGVEWEDAVLASVQHVLFLKDPKFQPVSGKAILFVAFFSKILIPIQTAFFALALRNKFRR